MLNIDFLNFDPTDKFGISLNNIDGGGAVVSWSERGANGYSVPYTQLFTADGVAVETPHNFASYSRALSYSLGGGVSLVQWRQKDTGDISVYSMQTFGPDGIAIGPEVVSSPSLFRYRELGNGGTFVGWNNQE